MKKSIKLLLVSMLTLALMVAAIGCGSKEEPKENTNQGTETKTLVVGTDAAYNPFEYVENGEIVGFDIEIIKAIAEEVGLDIDIKHMEFDGLVNSVQLGSIDMVISAMTIRPDRLEKVNFSNPYYIAEGQAVLVRPGNEVETLEELAKKNVGVQMGTTGMFKAEEIGVADSNLKPFPTTPEAIMSLETGSIDAVIADKPVVDQWLASKTNTNLILLENLEFEHEEYGIAISKKNTDLLAKINEGLQKIKDNGKYEEIYNKYFN